MPHGGSLDTLPPITLIGTGRLGGSLFSLLERVEHPVRLVPSRGALPQLTRGEIAVLCVSDRAISDVARALPTGPTVLHTSGTTDLAPLEGHHAIGSMHPLMTFPGPGRPLPDLSGVAAAVAGDPIGVQAASALASRLGMHPTHVPGDRSLYHAAAVLSGNGVTILLGAARRALEHAGVEPAQAVAMLAPLVIRSVQNAIPDPSAALTGPVARGDTPTLEAHRRALEAAGLHDIVRLHRELERSGEAMMRRSDVWRAGADEET